MSTQMHFLPATAEDYEELMSISGGIYNGTDYLPDRYHAWLKDPRRRMFLAKSEGKIVGFESFLLVDGGVTAVLEGLRVAPWLRGHGVAATIENFCFDILRSEHPEVKTVRLTRAENPPPSMLKKYRLINSKALVSVLIPSDQLEDAVKLLECRVDHQETTKTHSVLGPSDVIKIFEGTKIAEKLLPGELLVQDWLPLTTQKVNLEILLERKIKWIYSSSCDTDDFHVSSSSPAEYSTALTFSSRPTSNVQPLPVSSSLVSSVNYTSPEFLSLGTPPYPVPLSNSMHVLEIDLFGKNPSCAKIHVLQQIKIGLQALPANADLICIVYSEESLRTQLNQLCEGLTPFNRMESQLLFELKI